MGQGPSGRGLILAAPVLGVALLLYAGSALWSGAATWGLAVALGCGTSAVGLLIATGRMMARTERLEADLAHQGMRCRSAEQQLHAEGERLRALGVASMEVSGATVTHASELLAALVQEPDQLWRRARTALVQERCGVCLEPELRGATVVQLDGRVLELVATGHRHDGGRKVGGDVVLVRDTTDLQALQRRLEGAEQLATVGTLAATVAHELNNPLVGVMANLEVLADHLAVPGADPEIVECLYDARDAASRVRAIAADLRTLARPEDASPVPTDVATVVLSSLRLLRHTAGSTPLEAELDTGLPKVMATEGRLGQVLLNLLTNAIAASVETDTSAGVRLRGRADGDFVRIEVIDHGPGIPADLRDQLFTPFATGRPGVGTGLGLYTCRRIVEGFGGTVDLDQGGGAVVATVRLPIAPGAAPVEGRGPVLVVDDDPTVGRALARRLGPVPVTVVRDLAAARVELQRRRWDVVLVDVHLDGELGTDLLDDALAVRGTTLVFMSGGAPDAELMARIRRGGCRLLEKPFSPAAVWDLSEEGRDPMLR